MRSEDTIKDETVTTTPGVFAKMRAGRLWRWGKEIALMLLIFAAVSAWQTRGLIGRAEAAPDVALVSMSGERTTLKALAGKKTVLVLWAPWCGVCKAEVGQLNALAGSLGDDAQLVSVALSYEAQADVQRFIDDHGVRYPVLLGDRSAVRALRVSAYPTTYILDAQGRVTHSMVGYTTSWGIRARLWLA